MDIVAGIYPVVHRKVSSRLCSHSLRLCLPSKSSWTGYHWRASVETVIISKRLRHCPGFRLKLRQTIWRLLVCGDAVVELLTPERWIIFKRERTTSNRAAVIK